MYISLLCVSFLALFVRYLGRDFISGDFEDCMLPWYQEIVDAGPGIGALLSYSGDYALPYAFLIWLLSKLPIPFLYSVKMLHTLFDFGLAILTGLIVQQFKPDHNYIFAYGYSIALLLPNVFMNSTYWAQCDVIYTCFLLAAFLCYLHKKYPAMMFLFGVAFSFKLQSVFFLPFILIVYWVKKEFSILQFLIIPIAMFIMNIPSMAAGYSPFVTFTQYTWQASGYPWLYYFYPNLYFFFQARPYYLFSSGAIMLTIAILLIFVVLMIKKNVTITRDDLLSILLWTSYTCVFLLPSMHERYGYFPEMIAVIFAIVNIRRAWIALGMILCTFPKYLYALDLTGNPLGMQMVTAAGNSLIYIAFTCIIWRRLFQENRRNADVEN